MPGNFFILFFSLFQRNPKWPPQSYVSLDLEPLHGFVLFLVLRKDLTLDVCYLGFGVIMIIKTRKGVSERGRGLPLVFLSVLD